MKKNNFINIIGVAGLILLVGALAYWGSKNTRSAPARNQSATTDSMHATDGQNNPLASLNSMVGTKVPAFSLADRNGTVYSSENLQGKNVILFFTEGLMCYPACWNQMVAFAKDDRFKNANTEVLSVVVDSKQDWQKAIEKMPELAQATVVFDTGAAVSKQFNMLSMPSSMHPGSLPGHTFVLIDATGVVRYVLDDPQMGVRNDQLWLELSKLLPKATR